MQSVGLPQESQKRLVYAFEKHFMFAMFQPISKSF